MPRKSAASLFVIPFKAPAKAKLSPTAPLNKNEKALFASCVAAHAHLRPADAALLTAFCQSMVKCYALAKKNEAASITSFEKVSRIAAMWATKLRISTQSQVLPDMAGRKRDAQPQSYYATMTNDDDE